MDDLLGDRESARDQGLRGDHGGHGGQADQRDQRPIRRHHEKGVLDGCRVCQQQGPLTKIVQREAGHDHGKPGNPNRFFAEVAHVGVERLATRHAEHNSAQNDEGGARVIPNKAHRVMRADGPENGRMGDDVADAQHRNTDKPDDRDRAEKFANARGAAFLNRKQPKQDDQRERDHVLFEGG